MIAVDTSSLVGYLNGEESKDVSIISKLVEDLAVVLSPVVVSEILSDPNSNRELKFVIFELPKITLKDGFWERVGKLRRKILIKKLRCKLADAIFAQSYMDHNYPLLTRDRDFENFKPYGLKLVSF